MKRIVTLLLGLLMLCSLAACGAKAEPSAHVSLTLCNTLAGDEQAEDAIGAFAEAVWEGAEESVDITVTEDADELSALEAVRAGTLDMTVLSYETMCALREEWRALSMPYLFLSRDDYWVAMSGDTVRGLYALTEEEGFVGLTWLDSGARCFYTASKEIAAPEDLQGLRIASANSALVSDMLAALGAECVPMDYDAIPAAMRDGSVDGAEDNALAMFDHADAVGYFVNDDHVRAPRVLVISNDALARLDDAQREVLYAKADELSEFYKAKRADYEAEARGEAKLEYEAELVTIPKLEPFRDACAPVYAALRDSGSPAAAIVDALLAEQK